MKGLKFMQHKRTDRVPLESSIHIRLPAVTLERLFVLAVKSDLSIAAIVRKSINQFLASKSSQS